MATVKDTLWKCLLNFPSIFPNALAVYDHWFCVCGNGYEWKDGELYKKPYDDEDDEQKKHNATTINEAIINHLQYYLVDDWKDGGISQNFLHCYMGSEEDVTKYVRGENSKVIDYIKLIMDTEHRMYDFSIPVDPLMDKLRFGQFKFYGLSDYALIYTFPDDVNNDWFKAIKQMVDLMEEHKDIVDDPNNLFPKIKERVYKIYNERHNRFERWDGVYEIIGTGTREVGAGCHSFDVDTYKCRNIETGKLIEVDWDEVERFV